MFEISLLYHLTFTYLSFSLFVWTLIAFLKFDCILLLVIACFETVILFFNLKTDSIFLMFLVFSFFDSIFQF